MKKKSRKKIKNQIFTITIANRLYIKFSERRSKQYYNSLLICMSNVTSDFKAFTLPVHRPVIS